MCSYSERELLVLAYEFLINTPEIDMIADSKTLKASVKVKDGLIRRKK